MCKPGRDIKCLWTRCAELHKKAAPERGRACPAVYNRVENFATDRLNKLDLGVRRRLEMKAAQCAGNRGECLIVLYPVFVWQTCLDPIASVPCFAEPAARVAGLFQRQKGGAGDIKCFHRLNRHDA